MTGLLDNDPAEPDQPVLAEPLTTKEGWSRFVADQVEAPPEPGPAALAAMSAEQREALIEARRDYHARLPLVNTPTIREVLSTGRLLVQLNRGQVSARRGLILSGASGTGKTTALTLLGRTHERAARRRLLAAAAAFRLPVIYVTVPPAATPKMLAGEFARFLGLEFRARANLPEIVNAVCTTATRAGSSWSWSTSCTTSTWPPAPARRSPTSLNTSPNGCPRPSRTPGSSWRARARACSPGSAGGRSPGGSL